MAGGAAEVGAVPEAVVLRVSEIEGCGRAVVVQVCAGTVTDIVALAFGEDVWGRVVGLEGKKRGIRGREGKGTYLLFSKREVPVVAAAHLFLILLLVLFIGQSRLNRAGVRKLGRGRRCTKETLETIDVAASGL